MGRKILVAVACWLALSKADADATVGAAKLQDSVAEANLPRLYRSIPVGVYASASPYASFSFHVPAFATSPKVAHVGPIRQESIIVENKQGFLKDSYGNRFVESPQSLPYRTAFPQQYVQLQELPAHLAQPLVAATPSFDYKQLSPHFFGSPKVKVQAVQTGSSSTANHYAINQPYEFGAIRAFSTAQQQRPTNNVEKTQRLEENSNPYKQHDHGSAAISATNNNEKNLPIKLETKPPVPLLDLSLLEPLTFDNPLVPQVQHFLPRISSVTYHKLPQVNVDEIKSKVKEIMIQKTKSYNDRDIESVPKVNSLQRQPQQRPHIEDEDEDDEQDPPRHIPIDNSHEINSPNYRESYNEKSVNYNKETQSEPVHYSYAMKSEKEPLSYNYVRTTNEPYKEQGKNINQNKKHENNQNTKHLVYNFTPEDNNNDKNGYDNSHQDESEDSSEERYENKVPVRSRQQHDKSYDKETHHHSRPEHRDEAAHSKSERIVHKKEQHHRKPDKPHRQNSSPKHIRPKTVPIENLSADIEPILHEHEENIRVFPNSKKYASVKVDPNQHIQPQGGDSREPENNPDDPPHNHPHSNHRGQYHPEKHSEEKAKRIIITEETPQEAKSNSKEVNDEDSDQHGKGEEEFENRYNNAAYGFPTYQSTFKDPEKEIYNPEPYAPPRYQSDFDGEESPFQRYVAENDEFPKSTRSNYKDARDKTKDRYYLDYAISKPESMLARFQHKEDYYKMYMHRKPQYLNDEDETDKKTPKHSAKYVAAPGIEYQASVQKPKQYFAKYKAVHPPQIYGYTYPKKAQKDNSAYASSPYQRLKTHTQFVEPQFQYGFEPSMLPRLLDSELAAMASSNSPEKRKKVYKENWYIKKTSTNGRKAPS